MIKGTISTCLPEKQYGFIKGEDGKDYYFSFNALSRTQFDKIAEGALVEFDQKASAKGYRAESILITKNGTDGYSQPTEALVSKGKSIKGWEIIERGAWIVHGSSSKSPDDAKLNLIDRAKQIGANALIESEYFKTTGSTSGSGGGTYYYTIHNFRARAVTVAKKEINGSLSLDDLFGLNQKAGEFKQRCIEVNQCNCAANQKKRGKIWAGGAIAVGLLLGIGSHYFWAFGAGMLFIVTPNFFREPTNYADWEGVRNFV